MLQLPSSQKIRHNLNCYFVEADEASYEQGLKWYLNAHLEVQKLCYEFFYPAAKIAAIVARLSPAIPWDRNIIAAKNLLLGKEKIDGYASNVAIARNILAGKYGNRHREILASFPTYTAPKIRSFYMNILEPFDKEYVTIDRWMVRACFKLEDAKQLPTQVKISIKQYEMIADALKAVATHHNLIPNQVQAVIWESIRRQWKD